MRTLVAAVLGLVLVGCAPVAKCPDSAAGSGAAPAPSGDARAPAAGEAPANPNGARVVVDLRPNPGDHAVDVALTFSNVAAPKELVVEAPAPGSVRGASASDASGAIDVAVDEAGGAARLRLARAPNGALAVHYKVAATGLTRGSGLAPEIDGEAFRARGRAVLALPPALEHAPFDAEVRITPYGEAHAASSFGLGTKRAFRSTGALLRDALYLAAGQLGEARFDAPEGRDEAAWSGYTAFDPRPISADIAAFRTAARQELKVPGGELATFLVVVDDDRTTFVSSRAATAVFLRVGLRDPWGGAMRIAVASEVLKRWIGGEVALAGADPARAAEGTWFNEGVARALARSMLLRFGQITPGESIAEIDRLETIARTARLAALGNAPVAERLRERGAASLLIARGALYATRVDGLLRARSGGKRSLEDVARALLAKAKEAHGPLPERAWLDALHDDLGEGEAAAFASAIGRGEVPALPQEALGKCASRGTRRYVGYDLGFDLEATRDAGNKVTGLAPDGPAAKAGLAATDALVEARLAGDDADKPITLVVERAGARREVKYAPTGLVARGEAWSRRRDVPDEACAK
jgi:hypothetical protein